ncbi:uncharacterized protein CLUP02_13768 [Colletotrichum lupini]|uniref:Uncharacterized protein n=1 Tax=Colletotrichum lupini TaxID=145971 RepID=A0A9Q8T3B3_9PEZI|nr:uncharacterized protein CLUP02_13768 [Colletotrichum lupini]UQC88245.1 hypothetical protein CLUP02_13768 [Colletotrichum lupini]
MSPSLQSLLIHRLLVRQAKRALSPSSLPAAVNGQAEYQPVTSIVHGMPILVGWLVGQGGDEEAKVELARAPCSLSLSLFFWSLTCRDTINLPGPCKISYLCPELAIQSGGRGGCGGLPEESGGPTAHFHSRLPTSTTAFKQRKRAIAAQLQPSNNSARFFIFDFFSGKTDFASALLLPEKNPPVLLNPLPSARPRYIECPSRLAVRITLTVGAETSWFVLSSFPEAGLLFPFESFSISCRKAVGLGDFWPHVLHPGCPNLASFDSPQQLRTLSSLWVYLLDPILPRKVLQIDARKGTMRSTLISFGRSASDSRAAAKSGSSVELLRAYTGGMSAREKRVTLGGFDVKGVGY